MQRRVVLALGRVKGEVRWRQDRRIGGGIQRASWLCILQRNVISTAVQFSISVRACIPPLTSQSPFCLARRNAADAEHPLTAVCLWTSLLRTLIPLIRAALSCDRTSTASMDESVASAAHRALGVPEILGHVFLELDSPWAFTAVSRAFHATAKKPVNIRHHFERRYYPAEILFELIRRPSIARPELAKVRIPRSHAGLQPFCRGDADYSHFIRERDLDRRSLPGVQCVRPSWCAFWLNAAWQCRTSDPTATCVERHCHEAYARGR